MNNSCEKIMAGMKPVIRAYHANRWVTHHAQLNSVEEQSIGAEDLYREWMKRNEKKIEMLADQILDRIQKKIYCGELSWDLLSWDLNQKSPI
jgi:hypothetical protein